MRVHELWKASLPLQIESNFKLETAVKLEIQIDLNLVFPFTCISSERSLNSISTQLNPWLILAENQLPCLGTLAGIW